MSWSGEFRGQEEIIHNARHLTSSLGSSASRIDDLPPQNLKVYAHEPNAAHPNKRAVYVIRTRSKSVISILKRELGGYSKERADFNKFLKVATFEVNV